jgi:hypothetical protein
MNSCLLTASLESHLKKNKLLYAVQNSVAVKSGFQKVREIRKLVYFISIKLYVKRFVGTYGNRILSGQPERRRRKTFRIY